MLSSTELLHSINLEAVIQMKLNVYLITELIKHQSSAAQLSASFIMQI